MFQTKTVEPTVLDLAISELYEALKLHTPDSKEYAAIADQLVKLETLKKDNRPDRISYDTLAAIAANLLGLGMVLHFEKVGVVTSKALGFIRKI